MTIQATIFLAFTALAMSAAMSAPPPAGGGTSNDSGPPGAGPKAGTPKPDGGATPSPMPAPPPPANPAPKEADWGIAGNETVGFVDTKREVTADKSYGPLNRGADSTETGVSLLPVEEYGDGEWIAPELPSEPDMPEFHTVLPGDTLWGISTKYFKDPYEWPKLWSHNAQITNANWIFPGDLIRLRDPIAPPAESQQEVAAKTSESTLRFGAQTQPSRNIMPSYLVGRYAFVDEKEFDSAMKVVGGAQAKVMMATLDTAYLKYDRDVPPVSGERLAVYEVARPIYDARMKKNGEIRRGKRIGYLVEVVGEVQVRSIAPKSAEVKVVESIRPVERGMKVGELRRRFSRVHPKGSLISAKGRIVDSISQGRISGESQFMVVNLGSKQGLKTGNILDVVRRGDELMDRNALGIPNEDGHPRRVLGELLVLEVQENVAITLAVNTARELEIGDNVEIGNVGP
jgi:hypothetical protein